MRKLFFLLFICSSSISAIAQTIIGTTASDTGPLGTEKLSTSNWTSTGWTGNWTTGWIHATGNVTSLTNTLAATSSNFYQITYTITGRTAGTISIIFGGITTSGLSATGVTGIFSSSTGTLSITPTTDFDGTLILSIKQVAASTAITTFSTSDSIARIEIRANNALNNTFMGVLSGSRNTTGTNNSFFGYQAGPKNITATENTLIGYQSGYLTTSGSYNSCLGVYTAKNTSTGKNNVFVGAYTGSDNTTGSGNTYIGTNTGRNITTGNFNTLIGSSVNSLASGTNNNIVIADGQGNRRINVNSSGNVGINNISPSESLDITGNLRFSGALMPNNTAGTSGQVLTSAGTGAVPTWTTPATGSVWGSITGTLASQTDLQSTLNLKASLASPVLTGNPQAPTQPYGTDNSLIATTQFVYANSKAGNDSTDANSGYTTLYKNKKNLKYVDTLPRFPPSIRNTLYGANRTTIYDGNLVEYNPEYSNSVLSEDAIKFTNSFENTALVSNGSILSVERRKGSPIVDTVYIRLYGGSSGMTHSPYSMQFIGLNFPKGATVRFKDLYLDTIINLTDSFEVGATYWYDFSINASASSYGDRFQIFATPAAPLISTPFYTSNNSLPNDYWSLTGNAETNATTNFIGTTDNVGIAFRTNNTNRLLIDSTGNVGLGTIQINDTAYKLFVEKGIRTRKVKVDALTWADYVFDKDYALPTLQEVDQFIQQNKHLPGVLSTEEVQKDGIDLGENQATLLKKVEELTLYLIELDKKVAALSTENELLKKANNSRK